MKLLTLEEIEKVDTYVNALAEGTFCIVQALTPSQTKSLIATARAYWELKNKIGISSKEAIHAKYHHGLPHVADDRPRIIHGTATNSNFPHAPTIRAIVEALKESWDYDEERYQLGDAIQLLKNHIE